jgi:hypothetical protein
LPRGGGTPLPYVTRSLGYPPLDMRGTTALGSGWYSNAAVLFMKWSNQLTGGTPLPYITRSLGYPPIDMGGTTALGGSRYANAIVLFLKWSNQLTGGTFRP